MLLALAVIVSVPACTTLENRRDLYSPDVELYPRPAVTRTTTVTRQTTKETRKTAPEVRPVPAEPEESNPLPPP
jgi:hypothetical protein